MDNQKGQAPMIPSTSAYDRPSAPYMDNARAINIPATYLPKGVPPLLVLLILLVLLLVVDITPRPPRAQ